MDKSEKINNSGVPKKEQCSQSGTVSGYGAWVSVNARMPEQIGTYLVFIDNCKICMAFYNSDKEWCEMWSQQKLIVKHWMYLPKAP